jgi:hypothetical protein
MGESSPSDCLHNDLHFGQRFTSVAQTRAARGTRGDYGYGATTAGTLHVKPAKDQGRQTQGLLRHVESIVKPTRAGRLNFIKK